MSEFGIEFDSKMRPVRRFPVMEEPEPDPSKCPKCNKGIMEQRQVHGRSACCNEYNIWKCSKCDFVSSRRLYPLDYDDVPKLLRLSEKLKASLLKYHSWTKVWFEKRSLLGELEK